MNSLPRPGPSLRASTEPPCSSTRLRTRLNPSPRPPSERSSERSACANRSKTRASISRGMPTPVSRTRKATRCPSRATARRTCPPSSVYLAALFSRLASTCAMRLGSASTNTGRSGMAIDRRWRWASISGRVVSTANATIVATSTGSRSSRTLPLLTRETSSRSSTSCLSWINWCSTTSRAQAWSGSSGPRCFMIRRALRIGARGLRSSWPRTARNSFLRASASVSSRT